MIQTSLDEKDKQRNIIIFDLQTLIKDLSQEDYIKYIHVLQFNFEEIQTRFINIRKIVDKDNKVKPVEQQLPEGLTFEHITI